MGIPLFLVFGGIAASQNLLNLPLVFVCGFAGGWIADLFLYFLGYKTGLQYWMQFAFVRKLEKTHSMDGSPVSETSRHDGDSGAVPFCRIKNHPAVRGNDPL